jgi:hypothetical protein
VVSVEFSPPSGTAGKTLTDALTYNFNYGTNTTKLNISLNGKVKP